MLHNINLTLSIQGKRVGYWFVTINILMNPPSMEYHMYFEKNEKLHTTNACVFLPYSSVPLAKLSWSRYYNCVNESLFSLLPMFFSLLKAMWRARTESTRATWWDFNPTWTSQSLSQLRTTMEQLKWWIPLLRLPRPPKVSVPVGFLRFWALLLFYIIKIIFLDR